MTVIETSPAQEGKVYLFSREKDGNRVIVGLNFSVEPITVDADFSRVEGTYQVFGLNEQVNIEANSFKPVFAPYGWMILTQNTPKE